MTRSTLLLAACLVLLPGPSAARPPEEVQKDEKGTYLGILFGPLPGSFSPGYMRPASPRKEPPGRGAGSPGVVVTYVLPDSPAAKAGLARNDVVLQYDRKKVRDCEHLARLIRDDKPDHKVPLRVLRGSRELTLEATLTTGPALKFYSAGRAKGHGAEGPTTYYAPKGSA